MKYLKIPLSPLTWMVTTIVIYSTVALANMFYKFASQDIIQFVWLIILALPAIFPLQRYIDMDPFWKKP